MKEFRSMEFAPNYPKAKFRLIEKGTIADEMCAKLAHMYLYFQGLSKCPELKAKKRKAEADAICVIMTMMEENFKEYLEESNKN